MPVELKFRAWDKKESKWLFGYEYPNLGGFSLIGETVLMGEFSSLPLEKLINDVVIMQYTGLKDKDGKEIYEGDILKAFSPSVPCYEVFYDRYGFRLRYKLASDDFYDWGPLYRLEEIFLEGRLKFHPEVIGNIYENPDLIPYKT